MSLVRVIVLPNVIVRHKKIDEEDASHANKEADVRLKEANLLDAVLEQLDERYQDHHAC